jgi:DNA-directed RNA polymerase subunit RPC12/RpoP
MAAREPFTEAEARYNQLMEQRRQGQLDPRGFRSAVRGLLVTDGEGREWVLGPEDGNWYLRDRDRWVAAEPPRRLVCPHCGHHNLIRHSFCVECGQELDRSAAR